MRRCKDHLGKLNRAVMWIHGMCYIVIILIFRLFHRIFPEVIYGLLELRGILEITG